MTFDIKKLSTAFVFVALLTTGKAVAEETPAADATTAHEAAVIRAHNVFYNLFATNAIQAGRGDIAGNLSVGGNLYVTGNETVDGSLTVIGGENVNGCLVIKGCLTQTGGAVSLSDDTIGSSISLGSGANTAAQTISIGNGANTAVQTINVGSGINTAARTVNIANGAHAAATTVNILSGVATAGTQTLNLGAGASAKTINVGTGAAAQTITIGENSAAASSVTILAGTTTGIVLTAPRATVNGTVTATQDNSGVASSVSLTGTSNTTTNAALRTVGGLTAVTNAGFIKMYAGTSAAFVPYWAAL